MFRLVTTVCLVTGSAAFGQTGPSFDCAKAESSAEKLVCEDADLARLDRVVASRYAAARDAARGLGAGTAEAEDTLRTMQRGWIKGRDDCWKASDPRSCVTDSYLRREAELVTRWMLEPATRTAFWSCDGAAEVFIMHFDTELPGIRFEVGDSIDTGTLTESDEGTRYDGRFGRSIVIDGDTATYRQPDPDGTVYTCTLTSDS